MVTTITALWVVLAAAGGLLALWVALSEGRRLRTGDVLAPGLSRPFVATAVTVTVAAAGGIALPFLFGTFPPGYAFITLFLFGIPWTVFSLRYAGWGYLVTPGRVVVAATAVVVALAGLLLVNVSDGLPSLPGRLFIALVNILSFAVIGLLFVAGGLAVLSSFRHGGVPTSAGFVITLPVLETVCFGAVGSVIQTVPAELFGSLLFVVIGATLVAAVDYYDVLRARPGAGVLGERALMREIDEAVLVVDERETVARANRTARQLFGADIEGTQLSGVLDCGRAELDAESLELWTERGKRQFSPRITPLSGGAASSLGYAITLFDITTREIRQQRIQVLNRILRHNIRNDIDIIKAHAERLGDDPSAPGDSATTIQQTADQLATLSRDARRFEKLMRRSTQETETGVPLADIAADAVGQIEREWPTADLSVDVVSASVAVDRDLVRYALYNLVENAVEHNDSPVPQVEVTAVETETHVTVTVADDGPGIPRPERSVIETGAEDQHSHSTQFGLWSANWAVETVGGDLSLGRSDLGGTAVTLTLPRDTERPTDDG